MPKWAQKSLAFKFFYSLMKLKRARSVFFDIPFLGRVRGTLKNAIMQPNSSLKPK